MCTYTYTMLEKIIETTSTDWTRIFLMQCNVQRLHSSKTFLAMVRPRNLGVPLDDFGDNHPAHYHPSGDLITAIITTGFFKNLFRIFNLK